MTSPTGAELAVKVGDVLDGYTIELLLAEGSYSWVFKASRNEEVKAIKVAKPLAMSGTPADGLGPATRALILTTGGVTDVHPDPAQLLAMQTQRLQKVSDPGLVAAEALVFKNDDFCYAVLEYVVGQTIRKLTERVPIATSVLINIAGTLHRLTSNSAFGYHGDVKPDNIIIERTGNIKLIDPGYFGALDCQEENYSSCVVTTPGYYPLLMPDDLFAFGIMLWELAFKRHPLDGCRALNKIPLEKVDSNLVSWVREAQIVGQYFLTPLLESCNPLTERNPLAPGIEPVLFKALRLRVDNGVLYRDPGFANFEELADALRNLQAAGVNSL